MRHGFGTHAAMFGVNPWKLMRWMGHKRIDETMLYVHFAEAHMRQLPDSMLAVGRRHDDPDRRIIAMLSARQKCARERSSLRQDCNRRPPREENLSSFNNLVGGANGT